MTLLWTHAGVSSTQGITSRGRIGIDSALRGQVLRSPWFVDNADKSAMVTAINDILADVQSGATVL